MSDSSQGPGWWQASDGRWYPPESHPAYRPPLPPPPPPPAASTVRRGEEWLAIGGAAVVVFAAFMPWATLGPISVAGTSGDGQLTLVLGGLAIWLAFVRKWIAVFVLGGLVTLGGAYDFVNISGLVDEPTLFGTPSVGAGLYLTVLGGILTMAGAGRSMAGG